MPIWANEVADIATSTSANNKGRTAETLRIVFPFARSSFACPVVRLKMRVARIDGLSLQPKTINLVAKLRFRVARQLSPSDRDRDESGAPGEIRTPDLLLRRQSLYPAELRARTHKLVYRAAGKPSMPSYKMKRTRRNRTLPHPPGRFSPGHSARSTRQMFSC